MDNELFSDFNEDAPDQVNIILDGIEYINEQLREDNQQGFGNRRRNASITSYLDQSPATQPINTQINRILNASAILAKNTDLYLKDDQVRWNKLRKREKQVASEQLEIDKKIREAERLDMWKLWGQKLVRWSVGAFLAVLLYSTVSWVDDKVTFIQIPIKDLITTSQKTPS